LLIEHMDKWLLLGLLVIIFMMAILFVTLGTFPRLESIMTRRRLSSELAKEIDALWRNRDILKTHCDWARASKEQRDLGAMLQQLREVDEQIRSAQARLDGVNNTNAAGPSLSDVRTVNNNNVPDGARARVTVSSPSKIAAL